MLFYNLPVMNTLLMPLMISVIASRVCDMEVKGDTLKILYTMQKQESFFDFKYLNCLRYITVFVIGQGLMILFFGTVNHLGTIRPSYIFHISDYQPLRSVLWFSPYSRLVTDVPQSGFFLWGLELAAASWGFFLCFSQSL